MSLEDIASKDKMVRKSDPPIYTPSSPLLQDLINFLWDRLVNIQNEVNRADSEKYKAQFYLAMVANARILADLLKDAGVNREDQQDLVKLLSSIQKKAKKEARKILWKKHFKY
jgi:hypothetical protein